MKSDTMQIVQKESGKWIIRIRVGRLSWSSYFTLLFSAFRRNSGTTLNFDIEKGVLFKVGDWIRENVK